MSTNLKHQVQRDISRCEEILQSQDVQAADDLTDEIIHVYENYIKNIHNGVTSYETYSNTDHLKDINLLKRKLEIFLAHIKDGSYKEITPKPGIVVNNNSINNNKNENSNVNQLQVDFELTFNQLREEIRNNSHLSQEETDEIINKIDEIEDIAESDITKKEKWAKLRGCLGWLGTKGLDIGLKLLPIILEILKNS